MNRNDVVINIIKWYSYYVTCTLKKQQQQQQQKTKTMML